MNEFDDLLLVVKNLSLRERNSIYSRLKGQEPKDSRNLSLKLLELLQTKSEISFNEVQLILYGKQNSVAFKKLISRILEKIYDVYILKESIEFNIMYDERSQGIFLLERQMIIADILRYRGFFKLSSQKLDKVISLSKYFENYDILSYVLEKKRRWDKVILNTKLNSHYDAEIAYYNYAANLVRIANDHYSKIVKFNIETYSQSEKKYIERSIIELEKYFNKVKSKSIKFYLLYFKIHLVSNDLQFEKVINYLEELEEFILENKNIYSSYRHGMILINIGANYRNIFKYDIALQKIIESKKYLQDQVQNNLLIFEQFVITYLYKGDIAKMKYYLSIYQNENNKNGNNYNIENKIYLYLAIYNFIIRNYTMSSRILANIKGEILSKLISLEVKIMSIINFIELGKLDLAENSIESLKKYYSRIPNKNIRFKRKGLIVELLHNLSYLSFDFRETQLKGVNLLNKLNSTLVPFKFDDSEMILFHEWFEAKVRGESYNHVEAMSRLKKLNKSNK